VAYRYQVNGAEYVGKRIALMARGRDLPEEAEADLALYPLGAGVSVYYNPRKPAAAVLERQAPGSNLLLLLGAAMLATALAAQTLHS
jgi:hypothetical protein